ncbi:hypothetical protein MPSEU_000568900 [Mayamaea pseudoterrestris]|nr:hypothetical protein MPSEU_000568900 [Mayamaea pseudoterrestris]
MSERMIEMQRARLLNVGKGAKLAAHNGVPAVGLAATTLDPQQAAVARFQSEDQLKERFIVRLQNRDDSRADFVNGPTVPTSLTRRTLQRQGVGYMDTSVAAVVSAAADRFLATIIQQSVVCRNQRLKGLEQAREAAKRKRRHLQHYQADCDDRERRKAEKEFRRERNNLAAIAAAEALSKGKATTTVESKDDGDATSKPKKKKTPALAASNGNKRKSDENGDGDGDDCSYDSMDQEEEYYQAHCGSIIPASDTFDGDDDIDMLILGDIVQPLEAWDFHMPGKQGLLPLPPDDAEEDLDQIVDDQNSVAGDAAPEDLNHISAMNGTRLTASETAAAQDHTKTSPAPVGTNFPKPAT